MNGDCDVINRLLNETMHMDFPFLAGEDKKKRIVELLGNVVTENKEN